MKKPLQPFDAFEADLWGLWDILKHALDDQEDFRKQDADYFVNWIVAKSEKWNFYVGLDALIETAMPIEYRAAYGAWLDSRGIQDWTPPDGGPFWWRAPAPNMAEITQRMNNRREAWEAFKAGLRQQQKDFLKKYKAEQRAEQRAKDRAAKKTVKAAKEKANV